MSDDILTRLYTTTAEPDGERIRGGRGHLHAHAERAVACALERGDYPVTTDRAGKLILPMSKALDVALAAALGGHQKKGGAIGRLAVRASGSDLSGDGGRCPVPR